jgi:hypothetical protein
MASAIPARTARPRTVSIASYLLYIAAAAPLVFSLIQVALIDDLKRAAERAYAGTYLADTASTDAASTAIGGLVGSIVVAIAVAALGYFCGKGKNPARILVWIFAGGQLFNLPVASQLFSHGYFARKPGWYLPLSVANLTIGLGTLLAVSILLAVPASRPFFRKPQALQPPTGTEPLEPLNA